jgi:hypothetical protein
MAGIVIASAAKRSCPVAIAFAALALFPVAGCVAPPVVSSPSPAYSCLLPPQQRMVVAELFFGRAIHGRGVLSDAEWAQFAAQTITPNFPDGFTVTDGNGQWQTPATSEITHQPTKIVLVAAKPAADLAARLSVVIDAYKTRFHQQSVGIITRDTCAAF